MITRIKGSNRKRAIVFIMAMLIFLIGAVVTSVVVYADSFHTVRINYKFKDGTPAHDPYIATYIKGDNNDAFVANVTKTVTNPHIDGFVPMTAAEGGVSAETTDYQCVQRNHDGTTIDTLDEDVTIDVYYIAGLTHYRVMYYKQNIYDDLYTRDNSVPARFTDRYGLTGTSPVELENENDPTNENITELLPGFEGFTNLFHEPDAIAADGSTVFKVYYDRNYYTVDFNLGSGGYGVEPVYAKYGTVYHIGEPKREGYTFKGWAQTSANSNEGVYGVDWFYLDKNGKEMKDSSGNPTVDQYGEALSGSKVAVYLHSFNEGTVPNKNTFYKAIWERGTTKFSVVYWFENADSNISNEELRAVENDAAQFEKKVTDNYSVIASKDVYKIADENNSDGVSVPSGKLVNLDTTVKNAQDEDVDVYDFFGYNLELQGKDGSGNPKTTTLPDGDPLLELLDGDSHEYPVDNDNKKLDFITMSETERKELSGGKDKYFELNSYISLYRFGGNRNSTIEVMGDGTTRINVFYDRKTFKLRFFYAKTTGGEVTTDENGKNWTRTADSDKVYLTNSTKGFSRDGADSKQDTSTEAKIATMIDTANWNRNVVANLPQVKSEYRDLIHPDFMKTSANSTTRYWYYEIQANYGADLKNLWIVNPFDSQRRIDSPFNSDPDEIVYFGSWAVQKGSRYFYKDDADTIDRTNYTVKGRFDRLEDKILLRDGFIADRIATNSSYDYTTLYFAASWDNTNNGGSNDWNTGKARVYNFTYKNFTELLPLEKYILSCENGAKILMEGGTYPEGDYVGVDGENKHYLSRVYNGYDGEGHFYTDIIVNNGVAFGLKADNVIETIDAGNQYGNLESLKDENTLTNAVRTNQTAVSIPGFEPYASNSAQIKTSHEHLEYDSGTDTYQFVTHNTGGPNSNNKTPVGNPQCKWGAANGFNQWHHCDVLFFYSRKSYNLKYRSFNNLVKTYTAAYDAPLLLEKFQFTPEYPNADLKDYYEFAGWYEDPYHIVPVNFDKARMPNDDETLYAKWEPKKIKVSFYHNYNDFYEGVNRIHAVPNEEYDASNPSAHPKWIDGDISVDYGSYVPHNQIPVNDSNQSVRPVLEPPAAGAQFAGWYYLRDNLPVRFEPENIPVTALNYESSQDNGELKLYAAWVTKDVAKYKVSYVEKEHPEREVASPTTGRAFVYKTKTFNAKSGEELNEDHEWTEGGINWWPEANSHSICMKKNTLGEEYDPNTYEFKYVQKRGVWYKIQYLDAVTRAKLEEPVIAYTTDATKTAEALNIPKYVATEATQTMVLRASTEGTEAQQKAAEIASNTITFYYNSNDSEYLYEVNYFKQNVDGSGYTLAQKENITVPIAPEGTPTTVSIADVYKRQYVDLFKANGFTLKLGSTTYKNVNGGVHEYSVADDGNVTISPDYKTVIQIYFDRKSYGYKYIYYDSKQEREYLNTPVAEREGMWDGVIATNNSTQNVPVETEVTIPAPTNLTYNGTPYTRIENADVILSIAPNENNAGINTVKIGYRDSTEHELRYKVVCGNEGEEGVDVDKEADGTPLFGGLSLTHQTVRTQNQINDVTFHNFNDAVDSKGDYLHDHKYTFKGWYDNPKGTGTPITTNVTLTKANLGLGTDAIPDDKTTYYAVVEQVMIRANFEFRVIDKDTTLPMGDGQHAQEEADRQAESIVRAAEKDDGTKTGCYFQIQTPSTYVNNSPVPWHRSSGFTVSIESNDNRVYKYNFVEWWEEDLTRTDENGVHPMVRHKDWYSTGEWLSTVLDQQLYRTKDYHIIAVFKEREISSMPYKINYKYTDRGDVERTYVVKGNLNADDLNSTGSDYKLTNDSDVRLKDDFIMLSAPFESNYGETLRWKADSEHITKTSAKGDSDAEAAEEREDRIITTVVAEQTKKKVYANYRLTPTGDYTTIETEIGANYVLDKQLAAISVLNQQYDGKDFSYWKVQKKRDGDVIAKCYQATFTFCMMDTYYITPVFEGKMEPEDETDENFSGTSVQLRHLNNSRNHWTDSDGNLAADASTDLLYTDFEISFNNKQTDIFGSDDYKTGVVFELCGSLPQNKTFDPSKDYKAVTDYDNLRLAVLGGNKKYSYATGKTRSIITTNIPTQKLTNKNRVEFGQAFKNTYKTTKDGEGNDVKTYLNGRYLLKVTAFIRNKGNDGVFDTAGSGSYDDEFIFSQNPVYVCLSDVCARDLAASVEGMVVYS